MSTFLIIDGNWLSCRAFFVPTYLSNSSGKETGGIYRFISMMDKVMQITQPTHVVVAFDVAGDNFRKKIDSNYKSNRNHENNSILYSQNEEIKNILLTVGINYVGISGYEADDIIGTYVKKSKADKNIVFSGDKDLYQLIDCKTSVLFPKTNLNDIVYMDLENFKKQYNIDVQQFIDLKSLVGDESDNIKGVNGCGIKTASKLLKKHGTVIDILKNKDNLTENLKKNIISWEPYYQNLVSIFTIITNLDVPYEYDDCLFKADWNRAENIFYDLEFFSFIKKLKGGKFYNVNKQ